MRVKTFELVEQWPIQEIRSNYIVFQVYVVNRDELSSISCWGSTHIVCLGLPLLNVKYNKAPRNTAFQFIKPFKPRNLKIHNRSPALCNPCVKHNHYYLSDVNLKLTILIKQPRSHSSANIRNKFKESETYLTESKSVDSITSNDES